MTFLAIMAFALVRMRNLFAAVMISGIFSLICAGLFVVMDAVDVAFTEAAVGAGISTVLMLGALNLTSSHSKKRHKLAIGPLLIVLLTGGTLIYATFDMPHYGTAKAPIHQHKLYKEYVQDSYDKIGVPNVVTSILASYRGYDTMGEVTVIFTAGIGVLLLLGSAGKRSSEEEAQQEAQQKPPPAAGDDPKSPAPESPAPDSPQAKAPDPPVVADDDTAFAKAAKEASVEEAVDAPPEAAPEAPAQAKAEAEEAPAPEVTKVTAPAPKAEAPPKKVEVAKPEGNKKSKKSKKKSKKSKKSKKKGKSKKGRRSERAAKESLA